MNKSNLKSKTLLGFKWSFLDNIGKSGGQFIIGIVLARLLTPADFGLIGMITIFIVIGQSLTNSGFGQALIQKKNADNVDFSTVFYFNILASSTIYVLLFFGAPLIANFYNQPQLTSLIKVICLSFVIDAFGRIHNVHLEKELDFKAPSIVGIVSVAISGAVSITLAYTGFGVWALVANTIVRSTVATFLFWWVSKWRPLLSFSKNSLRQLFMFGSKIMIAGLMHSIFQNIYYLIIGKLFSAQSLGYYTRASQFKDLPILTITSVVQKVTFPVFSQIQDDDVKLISGYTKALRLLSAAVLPLMVFIIIGSRPLINLVLGEKWLPVVPYLKVMALYGWIYILHMVNNQVITVKGRSDYYLQLRIIDKVLIVISILITYRFGIMAMIYGQMGATILMYYVINFYLNKIIDIPILYQIKNVSPFFISAVFMLIPSLILSNYIESDILNLLSSISLAAVIYILFLWFLKVDELKEGIDLAKKILVQLKRKNSE